MKCIRAGRFPSLLIFLTALLTSGSSAQANTEVSAWMPYAPAKFLRVPCSFKCKEIPDMNEVLTGFGSAGTAELLSPTLKVLSWNVYKGRYLQQFAEDFMRLGAGRDLILVQEATEAPEVKPVLTKFPFAWVFGINFFMKDNVATGVVTGSYAQPKAVAFTRSEDVEPFVKSPKVIVASIYQHRPTQTQILVLNIHGINWVNDEAYERQIRSVEPMIARHPGPVLFMGDFNIYDNRLAIIERVLGRYGMKRAPWDNPPDKKKYDDAFLRGFNVTKAHFHMEVKDYSSDHPAMELELTPVAGRR